MRSRTLPFSRLFILALCLSSQGSVIAHAEMLWTPAAEQAGCTSEASRKAKGRAGNHCWLPQYDDYLREVITETSDFTSDAIPEGVAEVCPNYSNLVAKQKQDFWVYFVQALASTESGFDKYTQLVENMVDSDGEAIVSEGLLQLSYSDRGRGTGCVFSRAKDEKRTDAEKTIFDAENNLQCGASILRTQLYGKVSDADNIGKGVFYSGSYWNPLRKKSDYRKQVAKCVADSDGSAAAELGCQGHYSRRILAQFWDGYPTARTKTGMNLCGLRNVLSFCGQLDCSAPVAK